MPVDLRFEMDLMLLMKKNRSQAPENGSKGR
jgi:hypothetical protein